MHLSLTVALVPPSARPPSRVVGSGAAYDYCIQSLGCTGEEAAKAEGKLLPRTAESLTPAQIEYVCNWLQSELDLSDVELRKFVLRAPSLLSCGVETKLAPMLEWFRSTLDLGNAELKKILIRRPPLLGCSIEANLAPKLEWLQSTLDLRDLELKKMGRNPVVLGLSIEKNIEPTLDWMRRRLDLDAGQLKKI